jgi:hypothetical protein
MKKLKQLLYLLLNARSRVVTPVTQSISTHANLSFPKRDGVALEHYPVTHNGPSRNKHARVHSGRWDPSRSRSVIDPRDARELHREGHLQIAVIGFNATSFPMKRWCRPNAPQLAARIEEFPDRVRSGAKQERNVAAAMSMGIDLLAEWPEGRRGLVLLSAGDPSSKPAWAAELAIAAANERIGVHVIHIGERATDLTVLPQLATKGRLRYGSFRSVATREALLEALRGAFDGLLPARSMRGNNSAVLLLDASLVMLESFGGSSRIEIAAAALREYLQNPFERTNLKKLPLAA